MATEINRNASVTVGTDAVIIAEAVNYPTVERKVISIINASTGGQIITVAVGDMSIANNGIRMAPGGFYQESHDAGFTPTQMHLSAISDAAGGQLSIQERKLVR